MDTCLECPVPDFGLRRMSNGFLLGAMVFSPLDLCTD